MFIWNEINVSFFHKKKEKKKKKGKDVVVKINQWLPIFLACFTLLC